MLFILIYYYDYKDEGQPPLQLHILQPVHVDDKGENDVSLIAVRSPHSYPGYVCEGDLLGQEY